MAATEKIILHRDSDYHARIYPIKNTITVGPMSNHIHCETTEKIGIQRPIKMDKPVCPKSMCI